MLRKIAGNEMGFLRLFLALSVLDGHYQFLPSRFWLHGYVAVCGFFIISGFYMAMVLHEKYSGPGGTRLFYLNRALRILPVWWLVIALTTLGNAIGFLGDVNGGNFAPNFFQPSMDVSMIDRAVGIIDNLTLVPSAFYVMCISLVGAETCRYDAITLIAGQMLTVGLELLFYIIAPALALLRGWKFAALFIVAIAVHFAPHAMGLPSRPYQYEFFPAVLMFFMAGMASYAFYQRMKRLTYPRWLGWLALIGIAAYCYEFREPMAYDMTNRIEPLGLYVMLVALIPVLFLASSKSRVDRFLGDLSYPVYAVQFMVFAWAEHAGFADTATRHWAGFAVIMTISVALVLFFERPIDRFRHALGTSEAFTKRRNERHHISPACTR